MIDERVISSINSLVKGKTIMPAGFCPMKAAIGSALATDVAAKAAAADAAVKAATTQAAANAALEKIAMKKALATKVGAPQGGIISKMVTTTSSFVMTPVGAMLTLGLIIGFEFWRGKVDEQELEFIQQTKDL